MNEVKYKAKSLANPKKLAVRKRKFLEYLMK